MTQAYTVTGRYYKTFDEAQAEAYGEIVHTFELKEGVEVVGRHLVRVPELKIQYKVTWNTQEIPFWDNFEGAKACALAINTNKDGSRAKLISFMGEKEVEL